MSDVHTIIAHTLAVETITACDEHARMAHAFWSQVAQDRNDDKLAERATECLTSWSSSVSRLFGMFHGGESRITKDGELSLFVQTSSGFVYGLIFHADGRVYPPKDGDMTALCAKTALTGRYCAHLDETSTRRPMRMRYCFAALDKDGTCPDHGLQSTAWALPALGSWSFHS